MRCQRQHKVQHLIGHSAYLPLGAVAAAQIEEICRLRQFIVMTILVSQALGSTKRASSLACLEALARAAFILCPRP